MLNPLTLLPYAAAAGGGHVDHLPAARLVAAGLTLLQRSAPVVRALSGRRSGILLSAGPHVLVAMSASDGRGAVLLDPRWPPPTLLAVLDAANIGVIFTRARMASRLSPALTASRLLVLLDHAPHEAQVVSSTGASSIDLGSHFGLSLEGQPDSEGSLEECLLTIAHPASPLRTLTHRDLIGHARRVAHALAFTADDRLDVRWATGLAPSTIRNTGTHGHTSARTSVLPWTLALAVLLRGGRLLNSSPRVNANRTEDNAAAYRSRTVLVASASVFAHLAHHVEPCLRAAWCVGPMPTAGVLSAFEAARGLPVQAFPERVADVGD